MYSYLQPLLVKCPKIIIIHTGTNDALELTSRQLMDKLMELKSFIEVKLPNSKVIFSTPVIRTDQAKALLTIKQLNDLLNEKHKNEIINNDNINESHLGRKGLHLNRKGIGRLALNFISKLKYFLDLNEGTTSVQMSELSPKIFQVKKGKVS